ncbi:MAG: hypothetical protein WEA77_04365 [Hyphomonas sp.]|uniref:hypothetical protein n=1 Tax=Hyphomonas sp. TaxID=87 RepID=UPI0034A0253D
MPDAAIFGLLHILVFAYWLGGDLGAFYTSRYLILPGVPADRRLLAAKIVGDVDMAPRSALILTLPTGLALAESRGWLELSAATLPLVSLLSAGWLALVWHLHGRQGGASAVLRRLDLVIRWAVVLAVCAAALAGLAGAVSLPLFLELKLFLLAGCILLGLAIRRLLLPLGPALAGLTGTDPQGAEARLAATLSAARPLVACIWTLLVLAALIGLCTPLEIG